MDENMKARHFEMIKDEHARALYESLCAECARAHGALSPGAQSIIGDIAMMEQEKRRLYEDIASRGINVRVKNGKQDFYRENKSIAAARALADQQRRHLNELKLTPASQKTGSASQGDEFEEF